MGKGEGEGTGAGWGGGYGEGEGVGEGRGAKDWDHGICSCLSDITNCLCGCFCYPCLMCKTANKVQQNGIICGVVGCFLPCVTLTLLRGYVRAQQNIDGGIVGDALCSFCCFPLVNCQIANEVD